MLHPDLGPSRDPFSTWQVDTDEIRAVIGVYSTHLAGVKEPEQFARVLGLLWKKLGGVPRLARLVREYAEMQSGVGGAAPRDEVRFVGRLLTALGRPPRSRTPFVEDTPLYFYCPTF